MSVAVVPRWWDFVNLYRYDMASLELQDYCHKHSKFPVYFLPPEASQP